jgi:hypothetical protein
MLRKYRLLLPGNSILPTGLGIPDGFMIWGKRRMNFRLIYFALTDLMIRNMTVQAKSITQVLGQPFQRFVLDLNSGLSMRIFPLDIMPVYRIIIPLT